MQISAEELTKIIVVSMSAAVGVWKLGKYLFKNNDAAFSEIAKLGAELQKNNLELENEKEKNEALNLQYQQMENDNKQLKDKNPSWELKEENRLLKKDLEAEKKNNKALKDMNIEYDNRVKECDAVIQFQTNLIKTAYKKNINLETELKQERQKVAKLDNEKKFFKEEYDKLVEQLGALPAETQKELLETPPITIEVENIDRDQNNLAKQFKQKISNATHNFFSGKKSNTDETSGLKFPKLQFSAAPTDN